MFTLFICKKIQLFISKSINSVLSLLSSFSIMAFTYSFVQWLKQLIHIFCFIYQSIASHLFKTWSVSMHIYTLLTRTYIRTFCLKMYAKRCTVYHANSPKIWQQRMKPVEKREKLNTFSMFCSTAWQFVGKKRNSPAFLAYSYFHFNFIWKQRV